MKVGNYQYEVTATIAVTPQDVLDLFEILGTHYDYKCRALIRRGGTVYGWCNRVPHRENNEDAPDPIDVNSVEGAMLYCKKYLDPSLPDLTDVEVNLREVSLILKGMEMIRPDDDATRDRMALLLLQFGQLHAALTRERTSLCATPREIQIPHKNGLPKTSEFKTTSA